MSSVQRQRRWWEPRWWNPLWVHWLNRRLPPAPRVELHHKSLFILPSRYGFLFLGTVFTLYLLGTNYQNNLILALSFLLASLFITCIWHCYQNLAGLTISALATEPHFVGHSVRFAVQLNSQPRPRYALQLSVDGGAEEQLGQFDEQGTLGVTLIATHRGWLTPGRLRLASRFPLGLLECWTLLDLQQSALIYPAPLAGTVPLSSGPGSESNSAPTGNQSQSAPGSGHGSDELFGLRPYQRGESLSHVAWKQVARGRGMISKEFAAEPWQPQWLRLQQTPGSTLDEQLSRLCYAVLQLEQQGRSYGLDLGSSALPPASGPQQRLAALERLALHGY